MDKQKRKNRQHHKKSDKRIALLSLAVSQNDADDSACLTDEEMAALLDGVYTVAERETLQHHLAGCDSCYQHWVDLAKGVNEGDVIERIQKKGSLIRLRNFAWAGSFLAAAASVVLFLNITRQLPINSHEFSEKTIVKEDSVASPDHAVESVTARQKTGPAEIDGKVSQDFGKNKRVSSRNVLEPVPSQEKVFEIADDTILMRKANRTSKQVRRVGEVEKQFQHPALAKSLATSQSQAHLWLVEVRQGCLNNDLPGFFWKQQFIEAHKISNYTSKDEEKLVKELLPLLKELQQSQIDRGAMCKKILLRIDQVVP